MQAVMSLFPSWDTVLGAAPIDWCEANYVEEGSRLAEYNNTITNLAYLVAASALVTKGSAIRLPPFGRIVFLFFVCSLFLTGVTSGIFHATLIWAAQKADEIFENWTVLTLFHSTYLSNDSSGSVSLKDLFYSRIVPHACAVALGIWCIPVLFCELHLVFICFATVYRFGFCTTGLDLTNSTEQRAALFKTAAYALLGFAGWLCDMFACSTFSGFYLHAYAWHILTAMALHEAGRMLLWCLEAAAPQKAIKKTE